MDIRVFADIKLSNVGVVKLPASKSQSNRALIIRYLGGNLVQLENVSKAADSNDLEKLLEAMPGVLDVGPAGTSFRFLAALLCLVPGKRLLTGTDRLKKRPISPLVSTLKSIGADINYVEKEGYAPLEITGRPVLTGGDVWLDSGLSSQFATALMLIAPYCQRGIRIHFLTSPASAAFIELTKKMMSSAGAELSETDDGIHVFPGRYHQVRLVMENDWASASYFYALVALHPQKIEVCVEGLSMQSVQPDAATAVIFESLGITTKEMPFGLLIKKNGARPLSIDHFVFDFSECPDLVPGVAVVLAALRIPAILTGIGTLKYKESNRCEALISELGKFSTGVKMENIAGQEVLTMDGKFEARSDVAIETHNDHRMAMAFAPLVMVCSSVIIKDMEVVAKSYPGFWEEMMKFAELSSAN